MSAAELETDDFIALGKHMEASSFSRSGPGIWDVLKPEVVEYGGTHVYNKGSVPPQLTTPPEVCPELIRKSPEGPAFARDDVGTSFSAPKVTYIASQVEKALPASPALLYRALIAQSARWPKNINEVSKEECVSTLRHIGYGVPDVERATHNDEYRITLVTPSLMELGDDEAHIFQVPIPEELSNVGEDYDILVEVTLSYAANPRRTRRYVKGYLSTWLDWCCSRIGENAETFARRIFETGAIIDDDGDFNWVLGEATNRGAAEGYSRKNGTLQKDWCIIKSNQLSDAFCIAVRGHKGWGGLFKAKYSLAVSFEAINQDIPIYFSIHAPRVRSDAAFLKWCMACLRFQFSLPAWEAIVLACLLVVLLVISILVSAWGATFVSRPSSARGRFFNSRSPWGERLSISFKAPAILSFQFTLLE